MKQCDSQRIPGWFHLPEKPTQRVPGILTWEPRDGATLELIGGFSPAPNYQPNSDGSGVYTTETVGDVRSGTVYGETTSGKKLSIWDAQRGNYTVNGMTDVVQEEFWTSSWVCVGAHIGNPREAVFARASIVVDELYYLVDDGRYCPPQWTEIEGVENPGERLANGTRLMPYVLPVVGGYRAECAVGDTDDARYSVNTRATQPWVSGATQAFPALRLDMMTKHRRRGRVIELEVGANASVKLPEDAAGSAADFVDRMMPILDLVRLATFDVCGVEAIALRTTDDDDVSLLSRTGETATPADPHDPAAIVFGFSDLPLDSYLRIRKALTGSRQADYAWSVLIGHCGYSPKFIEQYVSQILAAAEGFHRWCLHGDSESSLNSRLKKLHELLPTEVQAQLAIEVDNWAEWAVWARNHVAHGGSRRRHFIKDGLQILAVAKSVHLVTYLAVLHELNIPVARMTDALLNHPRLAALVDHCEIVNQIHAPTAP